MIPGIPGQSPEPPGISGDPPGTPVEPQGTTQGPPGPQGTAHEEPKRPCLDKCTAPEALDDCIRILLLQRIIPGIILRNHVARLATLWAPMGCCGPGPCEPPWAIGGWMGLGPCGPTWDLVGQALSRPQ